MEPQFRIRRIGVEAGQNQGNIAEISEYKRFWFYRLPVELEVGNQLQFGIFTPEHTN
jgi:hypothetical protein